MVPSRKLLQNIQTATSFLLKTSGHCYFGSIATLICVGQECEFSKLHSWCPKDASRCFFSENPSAAKHSFLLLMNEIEVGVSSGGRGVWWLAETISVTRRMDGRVSFKSLVVFLATISMPRFQQCFWNVLDVLHCFIVDDAVVAVADAAAIVVIVRLFFVLHINNCVVSYFVIGIG